MTISTEPSPVNSGAKTLAAEGAKPKVDWFKRHSELETFVIDVAGLVYALDALATDADRLGVMPRDGDTIEPWQLRREAAMLRLTYILAEKFAERENDLAGRRSA